VAGERGPFFATTAQNSAVYERNLRHFNKKKHFLITPHLIALLPLLQENKHFGKIDGPSKVHKTTRVIE
jgi:hypothetical protein